MAYAWVTLKAKVFVPTCEVEAQSEIGYDLDGEDLPTEHRDEHAFEALAKQKISDHFPTDEPMRLENTEIDLSTYHS